MKFALGENTLYTVNLISAQTQSERKLMYVPLHKIRTYCPDIYSVRKGKRGEKGRMHGNHCAPQGNYFVVA